MQEYQESKKSKKLAVQEFLMTFFEKKEGNEFKELNGFILEKWYFKPEDRWIISVFTPESFKKKQEYWENYQKSEALKLNL